MSGVRMLHFLKDWWKFIQIHQYDTMMDFNTGEENLKNLFRNSLFTLPSADRNSLYSDRIILLRSSPNSEAEI